jgi:hypothetical protein
MDAGRNKYRLIYKIKYNSVANNVVYNEYSDKMKPVT